MTNTETAANTKQIKALKACPMSQNEIYNKYEALAAKYPNSDNEPYRTLSNTWKELGLSAKAIGLLGLLAYWSSRNMDCKGYSVARITPLWIAYKLGYAKDQASRHVKQIKALLLELHHAELVEIRPDKQTSTQTIKIVNAEDQSKGFAKLYSPAIRVILEQSKRMAILYRVAIYVAIRSITFETNKYKVTTKSPTYLAVMLGLSVSTVQSHLGWLRDHNAVCWFKLIVNNRYRSVKYVYADPVNVADLAPCIMDLWSLKPNRPNNMITKAVE
jgi:DNA-binding CsgD family transcriptional regulator